MDGTQPRGPKFVIRTENGVPQRGMRGVKKGASVNACSTASSRRVRSDAPTCPSSSTSPSGRREDETSVILFAPRRLMVILPVPIYHPNNGRGRIGYPAWNWQSIFESGC